MSETTTIENEGRVETTAETKQDLQIARDLVPVGERGVQAMTLAHQVEYAKTMIQAKITLPKHITVVGDCLAIIDISSRAGLSPYMVAGMTYVGPDGRMAFMSQLFHAFLQTSNLLIGDLDVDYEGEGGETVCVVTGTLRSAPNKLRVHRSPPLKDLHPGYSRSKSGDDGSRSKKKITYAEGQKMKAEGLPDGVELFSAGSPLWDRKPRVQMFYDTSRDWTRIFAPRATLGIYKPDDFADYPLPPKDVTPETSGLHERLKGQAVDREEGHRDGQAHADLEEANGNGKAKVTGTGKPSDPKVIDGKAEEVKAPAKPKPLKNVYCSSCGKKWDVQPDNCDSCGGVDFQKKKPDLPKQEPPVKEKPAAAQPEQESAGDDGHGEDRVTLPTNPEKYAAYALAWIAATTDALRVDARWNEERKLRNDCGLTSEDRKPLEEARDARVAKLEAEAGEQ